MANKKRALGRGLSALLADDDASAEEAVKKDPGVLGAIAELNISSITTNPFQPRTHFEEDALHELSQSIRQHGVIQPVTVRKMGPNRYQLISGERRYRASQLAGLEQIPAYVRVANDETVLEMALVENIQREDLDAIEVALSYQRLIDEVKLTQEQLAEKVAKKRATVTNYLRLLKLPPTIQKGIREKQISMGHARALINIPDEALQTQAYNQVVTKGLSVRQTEELARNKKPTKAKKKPGALAKADLSFEQQKHHMELKEVLDTKLEIKKDQSGKGKILIDFVNDADLTRILNILNP